MTATGMTPSKLDIGQVFSTTFAVVRRNLKSFALVAFLFGGLPGLLNQGVQMTVDFSSARASPASVLMSLPFGLIALACAVLLQAALIQMTVADLNGGPVSVRQGLTRGVRSILPLIGLTILFSIGFAGGLLLLFVPGVMLALAWSVSTPAYVIENRGVFAAFSRSAALTKGSRWRLFGLFSILLIAFYAIEIATVGLFGGFSGFAQSLSRGTAGPLLPLVSVVFSVGFGMLLYPGLAVLYSELRRIKEGVGPGDLAAVFD